MDQPMTLIDAQVHFLVSTSHYQYKMFTSRQEAAGRKPFTNIVIYFIFPLTGRASCTGAHST